MTESYDVSGNSISRELFQVLHKHFHSKSIFTQQQKSALSIDANIKNKYCICNYQLLKKLNVDMISTG